MSTTACKHSGGSRLADDTAQEEEQSCLPNMSEPTNKDESSGLNLQYPDRQEPGTMYCAPNSLAALVRVQTGSLKVSLSSAESAIRTSIDPKYSRTRGTQLRAGKFPVVIAGTKNGAPVIMTGVLKVEEAKTIPRQQNCLIAYEATIGNQTYAHVVLRQAGDDIDKIRDGQKGALAPQTALPIGAKVLAVVTLTLDN